MPKTKLDPEDVAYRVSTEGLSYAILHYFGSNLGSTDKALNAAWEEAHNALEEVIELLPDTEY